MSNSTVATTPEQKQEQELTSPMGGPNTSTSHPHSLPLPLHLSTSAVNATTPTPTPASEETEGTPSDGEVFAALHSLFRNNITLKDETAPTSDWDFNDVQLDETAVNADVVLEMFGMFTCFPKLPFELREQIWKSAIVPRLVHWRPGGGKLPGVVHTCSESRATTLKAYERVEFPYPRCKTYSIFINYDLDVVYRKQKLAYLIGPEWSKHIKRLAINLDQALTGFQMGPQSAQPFQAPPIWRLLKAVFPELEELVVILYPNLERGNMLEELVVVDNKDIEEETIKDDVQQAQMVHMDRIRKSFWQSVMWDFWGLMELTFMRIPVERHRVLCESCGHVVHRPGLRHRPLYDHPDNFRSRFCTVCEQRKWDLWKRIYPETADGVTNRYERTPGYCDLEYSLW